jgi:hypothetical protein
MLNLSVTTEDDLSTIPLEHDAAIGRLARSWAHLEHVLDVMLWELADVEEQFGACITAQFGSAHPKLKAIAALVRLRGGSGGLCKAIARFHSSLHELGEQRARAVHDPRFVSERTGEVVRWQITATPILVVFGPQLETEADLVTIRRRVASRIRTLTDLRSKIQNELLVMGKQPLVTLHHVLDSSKS